MLFAPTLILLTLTASATTLDEAYVAALKHNEALSVQEKQTLIAGERYTQAKGNILPHISGNGSYLVQDRPADVLAETFFPRTQPEVKLTLRQPLFRGLREIRGLHQQGHLSNAEKHAYDRAAALLYNDVAQSYHGVLVAEQDLINIKDQLQLYEERINELTSRVRAGTSSETDLITLQASRSNVRSQIEQAKATVVASRETFTLVTGLPRESELSEDPAPPEPKPVEAYLKEVDRRPDLLDATERVAAAEDGVGVAKGAHLPSIDVLGNYYFKRQSDVYRGIDWDVMAAFTVPIFSGGVITAQVRESVLEREQSELGLSRQRRQAVQEIRTLYGNYLAGLGSIAALEKSLELSEKNYQLLKRDYRRGLTRNLDVLQSLVAAQEARRALLRARFTARDTWAQLQTAAGVTRSAARADEARGALQ